MHHRMSPSKTGWPSLNVVIFPSVMRLVLDDPKPRKTNQCHRHHRHKHAVATPVHLLTQVPALQTDVKLYDMFQVSAQHR
jgi:hypothetical protein